MEDVPRFTREVIEKVQKAVHHHKPTFKSSHIFTALLFPTGHLNSFLVSIPVRMGTRIPRSPTDLDFSWWIPQVLEPSASVIDLDLSVFTIRAWPPDNPVLLPRYFTIFCHSQQTGDASEAPVVQEQPTNDYINRVLLPNRRDPWIGNVLITMSDYYDSSSAESVPGISDISFDQAPVACEIVKCSRPLPMKRSIFVSPFATHLFQETATIESIARYLSWSDFVVLAHTSSVTSLVCRELLIKRIALRIGFIARSPTTSFDAVKLLTEDFMGALKAAGAIVVGTLPLILLTTCAAADVLVEMHKMDILCPANGYAPM
uniref:Receptor ligand binding region domain-containing protein n=1 Tax=Mycena chlorophos TaxID=658473 RepID=A0ABQ0L8N9_MYCCL|nr:predicted protein [Mycena chlorophos]